MKINNWIALGLFFIFSQLGFSQTKAYDFKIESSKVINYYKNNSNPLKLKAANFILDNIHTRKSIVAKWFSKSGNEIIVNEPSFNSFDAVKKHEKELKNQGATRKLITQKDNQFLNSEFLIENIDNAFKTWEESSWHSSYGFDIFCEYILPYRNGVEPVEKNWRANYSLQYKTSISNAEDNSNPVSVLSALIDEMEYFDFKFSRDDPQPMLSLSQIDFRKEGSCPDLANSTSMIARSLGIATTFEFTPYHAASSNAHFWNTVVDKNGKHIPFCANQNRPYEYDPASIRRIGKAFRVTYSEQENTLKDKISLNLIPEENISLKNAIDVTHEYTDTSNISYSYLKKTLGNVGYISVYNKGHWRPTWWSELNESNTVVFTNMGNNLVYMPSEVQSAKDKNGKLRNKLTLSSYPILLDKKGNSIILKPNFKDNYDCQLSRNNELISAEREFNTLEMIEDSYLLLEYWENGWKSFKKTQVVDKSICLEKLPTNALFRLLPETPDNFERIFIIDSETCKIIWY